MSRHTSITITIAKNSTCIKFNIENVIHKIWQNVDLDWWNTPVIHSATSGSEFSPDIEMYKRTYVRQKATCGEIMIITVRDRSCWSISKLTYSFRRQLLAASPGKTRSCNKAVGKQFWSSILTSGCSSWNIFDMVSTTAWTKLRSSPDFKVLSAGRLSSRKMSLTLSSVGPRTVVPTQIKFL